jgi:hypothetical protein
MADEGYPPDDAEDRRQPEEEADGAPLSPFPHPPWTVGVVLILGVVSLLFGLLVRPIFLAVGSPFIIVLVLWLYVKLLSGRTSSPE